MNKLVYYLWALVPLTLFFFAIRGYLNSSFRAKNKEYPQRYFVNGLFCTLALLVAIWLDKNYFDDLVQTFSMDLGSPDALRWLTYPFILLIMASVEKVITKRKNAADQSKRTKYV